MNQKEIFKWWFKWSFALCIVLGVPALLFYWSISGVSAFGLDITQAKAYAKLSGDTLNFFNHIEAQVKEHGSIDMRWDIQPRIDFTPLLTLPAKETLAGKSVSVKIDRDLLYQALGKPPKDEENTARIYPSSFLSAKSVKGLVLTLVAQGFGGIVLILLVSAWVGVMVGLFAVAIKRIAHKTGSLSDKENVA